MSVVDDKEAHTDRIAEQFASEVVALAGALQEVGVPTTLTAQIVVQVVEFIANAYEMGMKDGADILQAEVDKRLSNLLGGKVIKNG